MTQQLLCREFDQDGREDFTGQEWLVLSGGDPSRPTWPDYLAGNERAIVPYLEAARRWLASRDGPIPMAEDWCDSHYLVFSDGRKIAFTWRGWGDFAQAVAGKREGFLAYSQRGRPSPPKNGDQ